MSILSFILHQPIVCRAVIHCKERKKLMVNLMAYFTEKVFSLEGRSKRNTGFGIRDDTSLRARYGIMVEAGPFRGLLSLVFSSRWKYLLSHLVLKFYSMYGLWQYKSLACQWIQKKKRGERKWLHNFVPECCRIRILEFLSKSGVAVWGFEAGVSHVCLTLFVCPCFTRNFRIASWT